MSEPSFGADYLDSMFDNPYTEHWVTGDGRRIPIPQLSGDHARNALAMIKRKARAGYGWRMGPKGKLIAVKLIPKENTMPQTRWALTPWYSARHYTPPATRPGWYLMRHWRNGAEGRPPTFVQWDGRSWHWRHGLDASIDPTSLPYYEWCGFERFEDMGGGSLELAPVVKR
jgi:hypothetical protein